MIRTLRSMPFRWWLAVAAFIAVIALSIPSVWSVAFNRTVRIVDSTGTVMGGVASATTAAFNETVQVVDATGHVLNSLAGAVTPTGSGQVLGASGTTPEWETVSNDCTFTRTGANAYSITCTQAGGGTGQFTAGKLLLNSATGGAVTGAVNDTAGYLVNGVGTPFQTACSGATGNTALTTNKVLTYCTLITATTTFTHFGIPVTTGDNSADVYDFGLYNSAGTLVADIGTQSITTNGFKDIALVANASCTAAGTPSTCCTGVGTGNCPTTVTIPPGIYCPALTSVSTTLTTGICTAVAYGPFNWGVSTNSIASTNSILPATITPPSMVPTEGVTLQFALSPN